MDKLFTSSIVIILLNWALCSTPTNANEERFLRSPQDLLKYSRLPPKEIYCLPPENEDLRLPPIQSNMPKEYSPSLTSSASHSTTLNSHAEPYRIPQESSFPPSSKSVLNSARNNTTTNVSNGLRSTHSLSSVRESTVPYPTKSQLGSSFSDPIYLDEDHSNSASSSRVSKKSEKNNVSQEKRSKATSSNVEHKFVNGFNPKKNKPLEKKNKLTHEKNKLFQAEKDGPKWTNYKISNLNKKKNGNKKGSN